MRSCKTERLKRLQNLGRLITVYRDTFVFFIGTTGTTGTALYWQGLEPVPIAGTVQVQEVQNTLKSLFLSKKEWFWYLERYILGMIEIHKFIKNGKPRLMFASKS